MNLLNKKEKQQQSWGRTTGIIFIPSSLGFLEQPESIWEVWYKGVKFAELTDLKAAHDRLQKLIQLDTTGDDKDGK